MEIFIIIFNQKILKSITELPITELRSQRYIKLHKASLSFPVICQTISKTTWAIFVVHQVPEIQRLHAGYHGRNQPITDKRHGSPHTR